MSPGPPDDPLEETWVALAREGDEAAFAVLVRIHQDQLFRVALRMTGDPGTAQDVIQDALFQAWQHLPGFRSDARFSTWVTRIVINRCQMFTARRGRCRRCPTKQPLGACCP